MKLVYLLLFPLFLIQCNNLGKSGIGEETMLGRDIIDELNISYALFAQDVLNDHRLNSPRYNDLALLSRLYDVIGVSYEKRDLSYNKKKAKSCINLTSSYLLATRDINGTVALSATCKLEPVANYPVH